MQTRCDRTKHGFRRWLLSSVAGGLFSLVLVHLAVAQTKPDWQERWERTLAEAKREGKVVVYGPPGATAREALTKGFEKAFSGISVGFLGGSGAAIGPRVITERRGGQYLVDVFVGSPVMLMNTLRPEKALDPLDQALILPEAQEPKAWRGKRLEFSDKERRWVVMMTGYVHLEVAVNSNLVKASEVRAFKDLLDPKWKGKIALTDPRIIGPGQVGFTFLYHNKKLGPDYIRALGKQEITLLRDHRLLAEGVGRGKYPIGLFPQPTQIQQVISAGLPVHTMGKLVEGSALATGFGGLALANRAPHPNAAAVYINWLLTKDGQTLLSRGLAYASRRLDVPTDHLPPFMIPEADEGYFEMDHEETLKRRNAAVALAREIFGG